MDAPIIDVKVTRTPAQKAAATRARNLEKQAAEKNIEAEAPKEEHQPGEAPKGYIVAEEGKYVAMRTCTYGIGLYEKGRKYYAQEGEIIPKHFEKV